MINALVDPSFLVALSYPCDNYQLRARQFVAQNDTQLLLPDVVLPATMYNLRRVGGTRASLRFGDLLVSEGSPLIPLTTPDFARAMEVMRG